MEWNLLGEEVKTSTSIGLFKSQLLKIIRPERKPTYNLYDIEGIRILTKLRLRFSALNEHKFRHNFESLTPLCSCGTNNEDNEHFFLHCHQFAMMWRGLFYQLFKILGLSLDLDDKPLCDLLLFGDSHYNVITNRMILEATISFIKNTKRFSGQ